MQEHDRKYKDWVVGENDVGASILQWRVNGGAGGEADPLARTYNFLERLEVPELELEADQTVEGFDPYDSGIFAIRR